MHKYNGGTLTVTFYMYSIHYTLTMAWIYAKSSKNNRNISMRICSGICPSSTRKTNTHTNIRIKYILVSQKSIPQQKRWYLFERVIVATVKIDLKPIVLSNLFVWTTTKKSREKTACINTETAAPFSENCNWNSQSFFLL